MCFVFLSSLGFAAIITLKDGRSVSGNILQKDAERVKIDADGMTMTYYADEIKDIDGQPLAPVQVAQPSTPAAPRAAAPAVLTQEDPAEKRALILKFIDVFGTRKNMQHNLDGMLAILAQKRPQDAQRIRDRFKIDEVIQRLVPLYDKRFTSKDLKAYIAFYSSAQGQKLISGIGDIMKESIAVSAEYLKEKFPEMVK